MVHLFYLPSEAKSKGSLRKSGQETTSTLTSRKFFWRPSFRAAKKNIKVKSSKLNKFLSKLDFYLQPKIAREV